MKKQLLFFALIAMMIGMAALFVGCGDSADTADNAGQAAQEEPAEQNDGAASVRTEVSRTFIEDCGSDSGYWDITYSDGTHEYIDVP